MVDLDSGHPMATVKGRRAEEGIAWFNSRPHAARDRVAVVVWDRSKPFLAAVTAVVGDTVHGIDRFPVVQQAVSALDAVVRSVQKHRDQEEATDRKKLRKRWLTSADPLHVDALSARYEWRRRFPEWRATLDWVQALRQWCDRPYDTPAREAL